MRILLVEPGKVPRPAEIGDSLEDMQTVVGGHIQAVYPFEEPVALICNEEGKCLGLPLNRVLRLDSGEIYDVIAGTFFLCAAPPDSDRFASLTEEQIARYSERFRAIELEKLGDAYGQRERVVMEAAFREGFCQAALLALDVLVYQAGLPED